jgi:hypothetical protein
MGFQLRVSIFGQKKAGNPTPKVAGHLFSILYPKCRTIKPTRVIDYISGNFARIIFGRYPQIAGSGAVNEENSQT